jgi:hypothetical protein
MLPVCNNRAGVVSILDGLRDMPDPMRQWRFARLHGTGGLTWDTLRTGTEWREAREALAPYR